MSARFLGCALLISSIALGSGGCSEDKTLKVTGLDPNTGAIEGGTRVTIHGNGFTSNGQQSAHVYFDNKPADVLGFNGDDSLLVLAPSGEKADKKVDVLIVFEPGTDKGREITLHDAFTYVEKKTMDVNDLDTSKAGNK